MAFHVLIVKYKQIEAFNWNYLALSFFRHY